MELVKSFGELKKGDKIVNIVGEQVIVMEYLCLHPKDSNYALFSTSTIADGAKSVLKTNFEKYNTNYRFHNTNEDWIEIYQTLIENANKKRDEDVAWYEERIKILAR